MSIAKCAVVLLGGGGSFMYGFYHIWKEIGKADGKKKIFLIILLIVAVVVAIIIGQQYIGELSGILSALEPPPLLPPAANAFSFSATK
jgi:hypothetical protein